MYDESSAGANFYGNSDNDMANTNALVPVADATASGDLVTYGDSTNNNSNNNNYDTNNNYDANNNGYANANNNPYDNNGNPYDGNNSNGLIDGGTSGVPYQNGGMHGQGGGDGGGDGAPPQGALVGLDPSGYGGGTIAGGDGGGGGGGVGGGGGAIGVPPSMAGEVERWFSALVVGAKGILFEGGPIKVCVRASVCQAFFCFIFVFVFVFVCPPVICFCFCFCRSVTWLRHD